MPKQSKRHLKAVPQNTEITNDDLEAMLSEETDEEFGLPELKDQKPVKLKDWKAEDFASIYTRFRPHLERHAKKFLSNPSQVDEVVQDAFLYLMVSLPELDSEIGVLRFMKWKVKNLCIDIYRAQGKAFVNSIDDIAEPMSNDASQDELLEQADDAAVVKLALAKLNPRHREVLVAQIYEEKTIEEIAMQIQLSENATRQLTFRARAAFKKALLGDVDTEGMSMANILSVAAKKAAQEAKKTGVQAMVLVLFLALSIGAFFSQNSNPTASTVAEAPQQNSNNETPTTNAGTSTNPLKVNTASAKTKKQEEDPVIDEWDPNVLKNAAAADLVSANQNTEITVFRASKTSTVDYMIDSQNGVRATFTYVPGQATALSNLVFLLNVDGIEYQADGQNLQIQVTGSTVHVLGNLSMLTDLTGAVFDHNPLSKALFQLSFQSPGDVTDGKLSIYSQNQ